MSDTLADLMVRNLSEVFGERDRERRVTAIKNLYCEDAIFFEAEQRFEGRQAINDAVAALQASFPTEFEFSAVAPLPAITMSVDCSGSSVLQAPRPSSAGWTSRSSRIAASACSMSS